MLVSLSKSAAEAYAVCYRGSLHKEESQETVIPDTMPDVGSVVGTTGSVLIRSKDVSEGRVRLEATVPARVIFRPEDGGALRCLDVSLPFYMSFDDAGIVDQSVCTAELKLLNLETRLLNPRKLSVRAELFAGVCCYAPTAVELPCAPEEGEAHINTREIPVRTSAVCALEEKTFAVTDEFRFPEGQSPVTVILSADTELRAEELRVVGSKALLKGTVVSRLLCGMEDGAVESLSFFSAFTQLLTPEQLSEDALMDVSLLCSGVFYEPDEDGEGCSAELHLVAQLRVFEQRETLCLVDAYSNRFELLPETEERTFRRIEGTLTLQEELRESFPTARSVAEVLQCWASFGEARCEPDGLSVPMTAVIYYQTPEGELCASRHIYQVKFRTPLKPTQSLELIRVFAPELSAVPSAEGAELHALLEARALLWEESTEELVTALSYDETAPLDLSERPTLVLLRTDSGADLWKLARTWCSTVQAIREANAMDELPEAWEKLLLIPRSV